MSGNGPEQKDKLTPQNTQVEIGNSQYVLSETTQKYLRLDSTSRYEKTDSVVIIQEPHEDIQGQFDLYKGLESFFRDNPDLIKKTIFLSEGHGANQPISLQSLIKEDPNPSEKLIKQVLGSYLITGYMAYEWKYQQGIPIIGAEDGAFYKMSEQFASKFFENPQAIFLSYTQNGKKIEVPLMYAFWFAISVRNKSLAQTIIEQKSRFKNPILFVGGGHLISGKDKGIIDAIEFIKQQMIDASFAGVLGMMRFEPGVFGGMPYHTFIKEDTELLNICDYLQRAKIGYTFLDPIKDQENTMDAYQQLYKLQANAFSQGKDSSYDEYIKWHLAQRK